MTNTISNTTAPLHHSSSNNLPYFCASIFPFKIFLSSKTTESTQLRKKSYSYKKMNTFRGIIITIISNFLTDIFHTFLKSNISTHFFNKQKVTVTR